jgi:hypothetical protein
MCRSYSTEQVRQSIRLPSSQRPYFTPGFSLAIPLQHATRIISFSEESKQSQESRIESPVTSDTEELTWHYPPKEKGLVTVETDRTQAFIGFVRDSNKVLQNISANVENEFCAIVLSSMDEQPLAHSARLLLVTTARSANTGMKWNEGPRKAGTQKRTSLLDWGQEPVVIEPVRGTVTLRNLTSAKSVEAVPLDGAGRTIGQAIQAKQTKVGWEISIGQPATTWYAITIQR